MIRRLPSPGLSVMDLAARFLVIAAGLSLNDLFTRALGVGQIASPAMFAASALLLLRVDARVVALPSILLLSTLASYVGLGLLFSIILGNLNDGIKYIYIYLASTFMVLGIITYIVTIDHKHTLYGFLKFTRTIFTLSAVLILASPVLDKVLTHGTYAHDGRFRGAFSNPNEASYLGVFAWIFCTVLPFKDRRLQTFAAIGIAAGVLATLSKGGIVTLVILMAYQSFDLKRPKRTAVFMFLAALGVVLLQNVRYLVSQLLLYFAGDLSASQMSRLVQISGILSGQINSETTTGRTSLWQLSLERFADNFPLGGGLGSFHFLAGGIRENGVWQGSHNLYLMILGEAGPIPLATLLLMTVLAVARAMSMRGRFRSLLLLLWATLVVHWMSSHSSLELRYILLVLSIALGLTIRLAPRNLASRRRPLARMGAPRFDRLARPPHYRSPEPSGWPNLMPSGLRQMNADGPSPGTPPLMPD